MPNIKPTDTAKAEKARLLAFTLLPRRANKGINTLIPDTILPKTITTGPANAAILLRDIIASC